MGDALVFEELDEVDGEETFADAAFAIEDENRVVSCVLRFEYCGLVRCAGHGCGLAEFRRHWSPPVVLATDGSAAGSD